MPKHRAIITASLVLALAALVPASAAAKAGGTNRPVSGTSTSTTILNTATGTGTSEGTGLLSHLGAFTFHNDFTSFTVTGPNTFSYALTTIWVAANGDEIFTTGTATGTLTNGIESTLISTITGGTGRFADASGTFTTSVISVNVSPGTLLDTETHQGQISYSLGETGLGALALRRGPSWSAPSPTPGDTGWAMSEENVELARKAIDALNRGDLDAWLAFLSPDVVWEALPGVPGLGELYRGRAEVREWIEQLFELAEGGIHTEIEQLTDLGDDRVFLAIVLTARGRGSGVPFEMPNWEVIWFAEGLVTRRQIFWTRDEALEAAGLSE